MQRQQRAGEMSDQIIPDGAHLQAEGGTSAHLGLLLDLVRTSWMEHRPHCHTPR